MFAHSCGAVFVDNSSLPKKGLCLWIGRLGWFSFLRRRITLLSLPRDYARVLKRRICPIVKPRIQDKQCGFRPGHNTGPALYRSTGVGRCMGVFPSSVHVNLEKVYDRVPSNKNLEMTVGVSVIDCTRLSFRHPD